MFAVRRILGSQLTPVSRCLGSVIASLILLNGCRRDTFEPDQSARTAGPGRPVFSSSTASGYVLISQPDSMGPQAVSFGRSLLCPAGKRILGGGVQNANYGVVIQESAPNASGDTWAYTVSRDTAGTSVGFTGWAVCADSGLSGYGLISQPDSMGPQTLSFGRGLLCPFRRRVLGGGVQNANYGVVVQETYPKSSGDTWAYTVSRKTGGTTVTFTGRAICADSTITGYVLVSRPDSMLPQALSFGRSLLCPSGKRVFSGGVQNANYGVVVQESHPNSAGDTWAYTVSRKTGGSTVRFTGWAACATATS